MQDHITLISVKVSRSLYCVTSSVYHGVVNYYPGLWGTGIADGIFVSVVSFTSLTHSCS